MWLDGGDIRALDGGSGTEKHLTEKYFLFVVKYFFLALTQILNSAFKNRPIRDVETPHHTEIAKMGLFQNTGASNKSSDNDAKYRTI